MASLVWGCCRLIGAMPHWLRYYVLQDTIYFIVYKCLRYRVGVVTENLRNSFPDRPMAEIKRIRRSFYHNLSEIFISTVSQAAMSDDDCRRRVRVKNLDEVLSDLRGRDALLSTAHFGCWEYDSFLALYTGEHYLAAVYHPLENKVIDAVYMRLRRRRNIRLIPMKEIIRYYIDHRLPAGAPGQRIGIGLIYTYIGLVLFLTGVNVGFTPVGNLLGSGLAGSAYRWVLIPIGALIGYYIVKAEPAVQVLNKQVEDVTGGTVSQSMMNTALSIGVACAVMLSMVRPA